MDPGKRLIIKRTNASEPASGLYDPAWNEAEDVAVNSYWNGRMASEGRAFRVKLLWSDEGLLVRFVAEVSESPVVMDTPDLSAKTIGLWDRDVCEIFVAPDLNEPRKYFEFEVAPTGEWIDLAIDLTSGERVTDWDYRSGMETAAKVEKSRIVMTMKIPWKAFGKKPDPSDVWLGNIFRCVGRKPDRGYLAWQPTFTEKPDFHVPAAFGEFVFAA